MKIVVEQEVGPVGHREERRFLVELEFYEDDEFSDARFADDDNVRLLDGDTIKLTACYRMDINNLVLVILQGLTGIFSAGCEWNNVDPVFSIRVKDGCEIRVSCKK